MNPDQKPKRCGDECSKPSGGPGRTVESSGTSRTHVYLDDETLQRMIETFGPLEYSQFAATYNTGEQDPFGMGINWQQQEGEWPNPQEAGGKRKCKSPRVERDAAPPYLLTQMQMEEQEDAPGTGQAQRESIMEWFDRSVEKELRKRRDSASPGSAPPLDPALAPIKAKHTLSLSKGTAERIAEASASGVEIAARLETDFTTELTDAVEKLAKAEAMCNYAEALQAAEEAALNAPPELVEQAAAEGARKIQAEVRSVSETVSGIRPIEVVGYVGITKPHVPKKSG